jgi:predicted enzyme related to lactoylglutathione lyase
MAEMTAHAPGTFCWVELATTDQEAAKRFYAGLFGWSPQDLPIGEGMTYTMLHHHGREAGALFRMRPEEAASAPPHWTSYVAVESADATAARARELGGTFIHEPFDVMDVGRMAVVRDPQGAILSVWEAGRHGGVGVKGEPGAMCWNELATTDAAGAGAFYGGLFGWKRHEQEMGSMTYTTFLRGDREQPEAVGGMYPLSPAMAGVPPHWLPYFMVEDADATATRAGELGATLVVPPTDIPNVGRFAMIRDPQGAAFAVIRLVDWRAEPM